MPYYLSIGMTWEQYWQGEADMVRAYRKAQRLRNKRENQPPASLGLSYFREER